MKNLTLTSEDANILSQVIECQYDIVNDIVTEYMYLPQSTTAITKDELIEIRKLTEHRIDVLVVLTHIQAILSIQTSSDLIISYSDTDWNILHNEIDCYLSMITDMVDTSTAPLSNQIQHIIDVNLLLRNFK